MSRDVDISVERVIRATRARLAAYAADPANAPDWYRNIKSVEWETPASTSPGARVAFVAEFLGRRLVYTYEIVAHRPGERLVMRTADGPFPMQTIYEWADAGPGRTRMRLTNRGRPAGFKAVLMPLMGLAMRRAMRKDLAMLDRLMRRSNGGA